MKKLTQLVATTMLVSGGFGLGAFGLATEADAQIGPVPEYHWCPGDNWHPDWGNNWDAGTCHDDHHRDVDGADHSRDAGLPFLPQDRRYAPRYHWCPGEFWRPEWGFNFDWNTCHDDHHRDMDGGNHGNDFWP
jgi:hypothetical protein